MVTWEWEDGGDIFASTTGERLLQPKPPNRCAWCWKGSWLFGKDADRSSPRLNEKVHVVGRVQRCLAMCGIQEYSAGTRSPKALCSTETKIGLPDR